jgi:hypothetical protein
MEQLNVKKFFLYLLVCSIALSALMGIWAIISGEFGELQGKTLGTTLTVVGTSILGLACGAFLESPRSENALLRFVPIAGIVLSIVSATLALWMIWTFFNSGEGIVKTFFICLIFAFSFAQLSLLSLARLAKRFCWSLTAAFIVILLLDSIISLVIIFASGSEDEFVFRVIGVLSVTAAALTVMIPIFHRLSRTEFVDDNIPTITEIDAEISQLEARLAQLKKQKEDVSNNENSNL